jgi:hydroxyacid-oxoacid transhydrogenase
MTANYISVADNNENKETVFTVKAQDIKFGSGALNELGADAVALGMKRVATFVDRNVMGTGPIEQALYSVKKAGIDAAIYADTVCEPNTDSCQAAAEFFRNGNFDGIISIGGGSVMDTAKAANLLACYPDEILAYVNAPIGRAKVVPGALLPHIACPTTSGTGAETTGIIVLDIKEIGLKTGIASPYLKPCHAIVDPETTLSLPAGVVAATGFDVLTHAVESYTARPFTSREKPTDPALRLGYQGATPYNDIGALAAIRLGGTFLERAVNDTSDFEAHYQLMFAATLAGLAFNSAGVHIPHSMSYSVATLKHEFTAPGYESLPPMAPHGIAVVLNAPAAFRFTGPTSPQRHLEAAQAMGADITGRGTEDAGSVLADRFVELMRRTGLPSGLEALGYSEEDIPALAKGAFAQQRPLAMAPRPVIMKDLEGMYQDALRYW